ncbi:unnamed protein product [Caenorhabditis nigoni]
MQHNDQMSPGYGYEPPVFDRSTIPESLQLQTGETYSVRGLFGRGGFSTVFRVRDQNGQQYAAKVLALMYNNSSDPELQAYQKIAQNPHNNLLSLHSFGKLKCPPRGFSEEVIITEACGPSIGDIMIKASMNAGYGQMATFSISDIRQIGRQIGDALFHLEQLKIYHLDIKPDNVAFTSNVTYALDTNLTPPVITLSDLQIKLIDYGNSMSHWAPGTARPMLAQPQTSRAPEVFMGIPLDEKSDVWSMGCLIGTMYMGKPIFTHQNGASQKEKQQSQFEYMVSVMNATIPEEMIEISRQGRRCQLNFDFLKNREEANNQDSLMSLMREEVDLPLFQFLKYVLIFDPTQRPSFEEVLQHEFLTNV